MLETNKIGVAKIRLMRDGILTSNFRADMSARNVLSYCEDWLYNIYTKTRIFRFLQDSLPWYPIKMLHNTYAIPGQESLTKSL